MHKTVELYINQKVDQEFFQQIKNVIYTIVDGIYNELKYKYIKSLKVVILILIYIISEWFIDNSNNYWS